MAGNDRIIIEPSKPRGGKGEETLSMKVARHLDPILRQVGPASPLVEGTNNDGKQGADAGYEESVSEVVERHLGHILRQSQPPPAPARISSKPPAPVTEAARRSSYPPKPFEDKPTVEDVMVAINSYDLGKVKDLRRRGAPLDGTDSRGWTPMATAITKRCDNIAEYLMTQGIDLKKKIDGCSYLKLAAMNNALWIGEQLAQSREYTAQDMREAADVARKKGYHIFARMVEGYF
ncbi:MAG: ankyrin repeat domain-containing protein [Candidatus ainarchaeum sp.]|nr:ankyrin repeat domain-containing protein [Candidatus ainarchaeum sp.]